ncbi:excisionase [Microbacterium sp. CFH 90308]|uniref:Excisionase n=1 Tax=Microbacterium salsuginis TaxID=2722803 RepID=A0ABX1K6H5_9MICO|nr:excisionase [Microbacterium sp. CFH 90308]NLP82607.1 excisionase [Microbacterium sp. CFH 90308]
MSERTGFSVKTLANWRSKTRAGEPTGPAFVKAGALIRYDSDAVAEWQQTFEAVA